MKFSFNSSRDFFTPGEFGEHPIRSDSVFLPRIQGLDAFFLSDPEKSVEHPSVADLHALGLALDLESGFGQIDRKCTWDLNS